MRLFKTFYLSLAVALISIASLPAMSASGNIGYTELISLSDIPVIQSEIKYQTKNDNYTEGESEFNPAFVFLAASIEATGSVIVNWTSGKLVSVESLPITLDGNYNHDPPDVS